MKNLTPKIQQAFDECRAAFAAHPNAKSAWCCHHEVLWEPLYESPKNRIKYILKDKPESELYLRFRNFRPCSNHDVVSKLKAEYWDKCNQIYTEYKSKCASLAAEPETKWDPIYKEYEAKRDLLYAEYWAKCKPFYLIDVPHGTWNGSSIFEAKK